MLSDRKGSTPGRSLLLPVPVQGASAHARFFDHAGPFGPCDGASETCCLPRSKQRRHPDLGFIAVGMVIADHPPHRSEHALLTHSAPTSSMWRRTADPATGGAGTGTACSGQ